MSGLLNKLVGGGSQQAPTFAGLRIMTSQQGVPIPIVYGTMRVAGHLIDYGYATRDVIEIPGGSNTPAGLSGTKAAPGSPTYQTLVVIALCEGPIVLSPVSPNYLLDRAWADKDVFLGAALGAMFSQFTGAIGQAAWGSHPIVSHRLQYSGTAYIAASNLDLGGSASLKNWSVQVQGFLCSGPYDAAGYQDAAPDAIVVDFLSNAYYGAGWDSSHIANLAIGQDGTAASSYARYCLAAGFYMSPVIDVQKPAAAYLQEILDSTNSAAVFSGGVLKVIPYGDQAITGNSVTFTPYVTPIYALGVDTIVPPGLGQDMIAVHRVPQSDTFNSIPVEFIPRPALQFNAATLVDMDPVDTDLYGVRQGATRAYHGITQNLHALQISRIAAQRSVYIRNSYSFTLPYRYILLEPMDLVTLTDDKFGLVAQVVRLVSIEEDPAGLLAVVAEEWPFGVATATLYTTDENDGTDPDTNVDPGNASAPALFDMPALFGALGEPTVGVATAGGANWGGAQVWTSFDNVTYQLAGVITKKATYGVVDTGGYANGSGFDTTHTLPVDLAISGQPLFSVSDQRAQDLAQPAMVGAEMVSYATATLTGTDLYHITRVQRGIYGTTPGSHAAGQNFVFLDDAVFRAAVPVSFLGGTLYVKLVSFNIYGGALQDITLLSPSTHTVGGSDPPYPASVTLALATTRPTPASTTMRAKLGELQGSSEVPPASTTVTTIAPPRFATVTWPAVSVNPSALLTGFEVALFTGSDPNAVNTYLMPKAIAPSTALGYQVTLPSGTDLGAATVVAAVRPLYSVMTSPTTALAPTSLPGPWRLSTGQTVGTLQYTLNLAVAIRMTQTAQDRTTVTFTVTLYDPMNQFTAVITYIAFAGLTGLTLNGSAAPASWTPTYGFPDTFVATLDPAFHGAGYVRITGIAPARQDGYGLMTFHEQNQDAAPTLALSIKSDGTPIAVLSGNDNTLSWSYAYSSSAMPSDGTASAGTVVNGRTQALNVGGAQTIGGRFYFKAVPYDGASASGLKGTIISGSIDYQNVADAQKEYTVIAAGFTIVDPSDTFGNAQLKGNKGITSNSTSASFEGEAVIDLPIGTEITGFTARDYIGDPTDTSSLHLVLYKVSNTGSATSLQSYSRSTGTGWQDHVLGMSEVVDGSTYKLRLSINNNLGGVIPDNAWFLQVNVDYVAPSYVTTR